MSRSLNQAVDTPLLIRFALPTICSMLSAGLYGTVDGIFVARLVGADALAAVNIVAPLLIFGESHGHMFGMGGSALVARTLGEGDDAAAREYFSLILYTVGLLGMAILFAGEALLEPLLGLLGSDAALLPLCRDYARPLLLFFPFLLQWIVLFPGSYGIHPFLVLPFLQKGIEFFQDLLGVSLHFQLHIYIFIEFRRIDIDLNNRAVPGKEPRIAEHPV